MSAIKIAVIGLGYVGLPLARLLATKYKVVGFDKSKKRIDEINSGQDSNKELSAKELTSVLLPEFDKNPGLKCTHDINDIADCNHYILTIPTPIDNQNNPDLMPLRSACVSVGKILKKGDLVIFESTVFPGVTEDICVPILEKTSGLAYNTEFFVGYSPERINPGDSVRTLDKIVKITSGSTPEIAERVNALYDSIITAGTYQTKSIKVAEAAKVIENAQRDINIAFVNELAKIFNRINIDTNEVLEAAGTKWNFMPFKPGLVGGHCIGVDPYYLAFKAQEVGYVPEIILAGRRINDGMGKYVAEQVNGLMIKKNIVLSDAQILILGITFKENCPDVRNSLVIDLISHLSRQGSKISVIDPWASEEEVLDEYGIQLLKEPFNQKFDAVVLAVAHTEFRALDYQALLKERAVLYDIKNVIEIDVDGRL